MTTMMMMTQTLIVAPWFGVSASLSLTLHLPQCWRLSVCPESKPGHPQSPEFWGPPGPCPPLLSSPPVSLHRQVFFRVLTGGLASLPGMVFIPFYLHLRNVVRIWGRDSELLRPLFPGLRRPLASPSEAAPGASGPGDTAPCAGRRGGRRRTAAGYEDEKKLG